MLALFDLNGFKRYNDTYGHPAGDQLLARLGQRLADAVGPQGRAYRLGGDEFCVLAAMDPPSRTPPIRLSACAAALTSAARASRWTPPRGIGDAARRGQDATGALQLADTRMYAHKRGGRGLGRPSRPARRSWPPCPRAAPTCRLAPRGGGRAGLGGGARARHVGRGARRGPAGGRAPRPRQDRHPRRDPEQARAAQRRGVGVHAPPHARRRAHPELGPGAGPGRRAWCAPATSGSTAPATPTAWRGTRSRSAPAWWRSATPTRP